MLGLDRAAFDLADRDASHISAIVIGVHPGHRKDFVNMADIHEEVLERMERQRERENRRRECVELERAQLETIQKAQREQTELLPPVSANAYSPVYDRD